MILSRLTAICLFHAALLASCIVATMVDETNDVEADEQPEDMEDTHISNYFYISVAYDLELLPFNMSPEFRRS